MEYRIEKKEAFRIVGKSIALAQNIEENFQQVPGFWGKISTDGTLGRLAPLMNTDLKGLLGVSACNQSADTWRYYIAVASNAPAGEFEETIVPAFTWAIFPGQGNNLSIQDLERRIVTDWLPTSGYEYADGPDVEVYLNPDPTNAQYEVWIPVVKK